MLRTVAESDVLCWADNAEWIVIWWCESSCAEAVVLSLNQSLSSVTQGTAAECFDVVLSWSRHLHHHFMCSVMMSRSVELGSSQVCVLAQSRNLNFPFEGDWLRARTTAWLYIEPVLRSFPRCTVLAAHATSSVSCHHAALLHLLVEEFRISLKSSL